MASRDNNQFGELLQRLRRERELSQCQLAAEAALSERTISDLERGINHPRKATLNHLKDALQLLPEEMEPFFVAARSRGVATSTFSMPQFNPTLQQFGANLGSPCTTEKAGFVSLEPGRLGSEQSSRASEIAPTVDAETLQTRLSMLHSPTTLLDPLAKEDLIGRRELVADCRKRLKVRRFLALYGLPGVGKSTLAMHLAHDKALRRQCSDGILFAALGPEPNIASLLGSWGAQLSIGSAAAANAGTADEWAHTIHAVIGERRMLLVIDDIWQMEHVIAFKVGGPNCRYIITTRFPPLATAFAGEDALTVAELTETDSNALLGRLAPRVIQADPLSARRLVRYTGGLPLALQILGNHLRMEAMSGHPRRIHAALTALYKAEKRLGLEQAIGPIERPAALPLGSGISLQAIIDSSVQRLSMYPGMGENACKALGMLSVFPPKPNSFSEDAGAAVCRMPVEVLDLLYDWGLLEASDDGRYTLHQVIHSYAQMRITDRERLAAQRRMLLCYAALVEQHTNDYTLLDLERNNILTALRKASQDPGFATFIQAVTAFAPFLEIRGEYKALGLLLKQAEEGAIALGDTEFVAQTRLYLGHLAELRGDYVLAEGFYDSGLAVSAQRVQTKVALIARRANLALRLGSSEAAEQLAGEGMQLAQQSNRLQTAGVLLRIKAEAAGNRGDLAVGDELYPKALVLADQEKDEETAIGCLQNMGIIAHKRGNHQQAMQYFREALDRARGIHYVQRVVGLQNALGCTYATYASSQQGSQQEESRDRAEKLLLDCLEEANTFRLPHWQNNALQNLGALERDRKQFRKALRYLLQAMSIANTLGARWLISETECELGHLYREAGKLEKAIKAYEKAMELANEQGDIELELDALAGYGLGRAWEAKGNKTKALEYGTKSLQQFTILQFVQAKEVADWLGSL